MDEDPGVRAPVTRLRRRMSVEQTEESKSPAVGTPTKKRGGRKAAKPDLELIDENTPDNTTTNRTTKKTATKDVTAPEEKPVTPARRSTRVKSNTSILTEAAAVIDSPRAKRATRRASVAGSDTEAPLTPIRQTRRTRKDSASSVEKEPQLPPKQGLQITEVIIEEPEANSIKLTPHAVIATDQCSPNSPRQSLRLLEKKKTSPAKITVEESSNDIPVSETTATIPAQNSSIKQDSISLSSENTSDEPKNKTDTPYAQSSDTQTLQNRLSIGSAKLIKELNTDIKNKSNFNKSWSNADSKESKTKRKRTKSWTTRSVSNENQFYSDNESTKNKIKNSITSPMMLLNKSGSGDDALNTSLEQSMSNKSASKRKKKDSMNFVVENINKPLDKINTIDNDIETKNETLSIAQNNTKNYDTITSELLEKEPSGDIKTVIYIEDSDSNSDKINIKTRHENEDQCVPVVEHSGATSPIKVNTFTSILDKNEQNMLNNSKELLQRKDSEPLDCEPMDIDETMPDNIIIPEMESTDLNKSGRKSSVLVSNLSGEVIMNTSERKSSITQSFDKSEIETKSIHILSHMKDTSTADISIAAKSPQVINNKLLSTVDDLNVTQENEMKKNLSHHYSTSTPLQDKNIKNYKAAQVNTSIPAIQNNESINTIKEVPNTSKDRHKNISKTENSESSEDENSKEPTYIGNAKTKHKGKNSSNKKETSMNQTPGVKESEEKIETDENVFNQSLCNVNIEGIVTHKQESKVDVSLNKNSTKPLTKTKGYQKKKSSSEESEEEIESDDDAAEKRLFIDEEAVDAGDDYESGDSQNESERQYARENEVLDKGETLTTSDEFSDESDYEKDSFIVSSNEEDDELLDGTDDDLSMSDKELVIAAKSKKKYNDRKVREQKEASREMFESRHKLNSSSKSRNSEIGKTKKNKRQQISSSESEEDIKPRKNNRLRLDSTKEASLLADKSEHKISIKINKQQPDSDSSSDESIKRLGSTKEASLLADKSEYKISIKKNKQLPDSDSSSDESVPNEKEMTICNETIKESDPLSAQIKTEPKTPQRSANSTIAFIDSEEVDNDQIDKNESTKTQSEFLDPLQATMVADDDDDDSLSSDTDIMQNYDSILKDLNKSSKVKPKESDISLNLDTKSKKKEKTAIVDELNLTRVKSDKKPKNKQKKEPSTSVNGKVSKKDDDGASSDSIDFHLLFSEDSNNSDTSSHQNKIKTANTNTEEIIPLKRTDAKTDIRENKGDEEPNAIFFIDIIGDHTQDDTNQSTENFDFSKDKPVNTSVNETPAKGSCEDAPLEISYKKEESTKRKSKAQDNIGIVIDQTGYEPEKSINKSIAKTPGSVKKKKTIDKEISENADYEPDKSINKSVAKIPSSEKKNKKKTMEEEISEHADYEPNKSMNKSIATTPSNEKKNKKKTMEEEISEHADYEPNKSINTSIAKTPSNEKKNKKKTMEEEISGHADYEPNKSINKSIAKTPSSEKKNKKKTMEEEISEHADYEPNKSMNKSIATTPSNEKKNKKKTMEEEISEHADYEPNKSINTSIAKTPSNEKKNKKKTMEEEISGHADYEPNKSINKSIAKTPSSEKKNKKKTMEEEISEHADYEPNKSMNKSIAKTPSSDKKNKNKTMEEEILKHADYEPDKSINKSIAKTSGSDKKNKNKTMEEEISKHADHTKSDTTSNKSLLKTPNSGKKKKRHTESHSEEQNINQEVPIEPKTSEKKKNKKAGPNLLALNDKIPSIPVNQEIPIESKTTEKKKSKNAGPNLLALDDKIPSIPDNQDLPNESETSENHYASNSAADENIPVEITENIETSSKKRKRKSSLNTTKEEVLPADVDTAKSLNESIDASKKKKRKIVTQEEIVSETVPIAEIHDESRNKRQDKKSPCNVPNISSNIGDINKKRNKKRKEREDEDTSSSKTPKVNIFGRVPRLPPNLLEKLDDVPHRQVPSKKPKLISTTQFFVEETMKRKNKPSDYLEESIYLNESKEKRRNKKKRLEKPKVLPFVPTASTSNSGFTTNFKINVLPSDITFVAQSNTINSFKDNYMFGKKIKRLGTYDLYKRQRNIKLSKF